MRLKLLFCIYSFCALMACTIAPWNVCAQDDVDWKVVARNVRIVNIERGQSRRADVYRNVINAKYAILPDPARNQEMFYIEYADRPSYKYMFTYGDAFLGGKKWYFNMEKDLVLPVENDMAFVGLIKAYSGPHSGYFRLFRSVVDRSLTAVGEDPFFGWIVDRSDNPNYKYMFRQNGIYWYFNWPYKNK